MDTAKTAHLQFIQNVINRLSNNSFLLKGWTVVLVSALFALSAVKTPSAFVLLAFFPAVVFWGLDGYFLAKERQFRRLYDHVRRLEGDGADFSMQLTLTPDNPKRWDTAAADWLGATLSKTLIPFYGVILVSILAVLLFTP